MNKHLSKLIYNCIIKRDALLGSYMSGSSKKKWLAIIGGSLAIFSTIFMTTTIESLLTEKIVEAISATLSLTGGILVLVSTFMKRDEEIASIYSGAGRFLSLRLRAESLVNEGYAGWEDSYEQFQPLVNDYRNLSDIYDKYIIEYQPKTVDFKYSRTGSMSIGAGVFSDDIGENAYKEYIKENKIKLNEME